MPGLRENASTFYPPRSRWYSRILYGTLRPVRSRLRTEGLQLPVRLAPFPFVMSLVVPGLSLVLLGRKLLGWIFMMVYVGAAVTFVAGLGYLSGEVGYGVLISIHATSVYFVEAHWLQKSSLGTRIVMAVLTLFAVWGLLYAPAVRYAERRWMVPMRLGNRVVIVKPGVTARNLKRGDLVAYHIAGNRGMGYDENRVVVESGLGLDTLFALPGDHVQYSNGVVFINGQAMAAAGRMPTSGEFDLPQNVWFIWPNLDIYRHGGAAYGVSATMQDVGMVTEKQIIGRAYKSWCGRRQMP